MAAHSARAALGQRVALQDPRALAWPLDHVRWARAELPVLPRVLRRPHEHDAQPLVEGAPPDELLDRPHVLPLPHTVEAVLAVQYPLLVVPLGLEEDIQELVELLDEDVAVQLPPPPEQPLLLQPQRPLAVPLLVRDRDRWPVEHAHREVAGEPQLGVFKVVEEPPRPRRREPVDAVDPELLVPAQLPAVA